MTQAIACRISEAPNGPAPRRAPALLVADLATELLNHAQIEAPIDAFVLARRYDIHLRATRGAAPDPDVDIGTITFDVTAYWRDVHGEIARKFARRALVQRKLDASARGATALAKQLLLPPADFARDASRLNFDIEDLGALHRHAPIEWVSERLRSLARDRRARAGTR